MGGSSSGPANAVGGALQQGFNATPGGRVVNKLSGKGPLSGMIGQGGGFAGTGVDAPQMANIQQGTSLGDVQGAQGNVNNALNGQRGLLDALQRQGGLDQQRTAMQQQTNLNNQLNSANGIGTQQSAIHGLQGAAGMYQNIAEGRGPNPAQAALNQATGQNVANQAALMAGQRGAGANAGLMARQVAQQGAATQQQAVGQGATMQAQQQVNALAGLTGANQAIGGLGTSQLAAQQAQQQAMANQANVVAGQQIAGVNTGLQANLANQQQMQNALQGINASNVAAQGNVNSANAALAGGVLAGQQALIGGGMNGLGAAFAAEGGEIHKMADGGLTPATPAPPAAAAPVVQDPAVVAPVAQPAPIQDPGPASSFGKFLSGWSADSPSAVNNGFEDMGGSASGTKALNKGASSMSSGIAGKLKSGEAMAAEGGLAKAGGHVKAKAPAQKAVKGGDSYANDKIDAKLSEGEIVLPRSVTMSKDPVAASAEFVRKVVAKRKAK